MRYGALLMAFALACGLPVEPAPWRPPEASLVEPHSDYRAWWTEVETCVGVSGDFDRIRWFTVEGTAFNTPDYGWAGGRWVPPHDIYLAETNYTSEGSVKHEMIHELLRPGDSEDPRFEECSGTGH